MTAKAPPVLWVVVNNQGHAVEFAHTRDYADSRLSEYEFDCAGTGPHRVVAYVPRDTP